MTRETIKEYILQVKSQDGTEALYNRWEPDILVEVINEIFNDHEAQLRVKDEEIHYLKTQMTGWSMLFDEPQEQDKKARSIVAMLFWSYKRKEEQYGKHALITGSSYVIFQKAYKILKETK